MRPSEVISVDKPISRCTGMASIGLILPHYVAIDRKPQNGCEMQDSACGRSGIMLPLELVTTAEDEKARAFEGDTVHGTADCVVL